MLARASASLSVLSGYTILRIVVSHISIGLVSPHSTPTHAKSARAGDPGSGARALFCSAPTASRGLTYFRAYGAGAEQKTRYSKI